MSFPRILAPAHTYAINRIALVFVGLTAIADLEHVGRRTGRTHHTPVRAYRSNDTVVIGINFGRKSDWLKNIQAARGCRLRLGNEVMELANPRLVPIEHCVRLMPRLTGVVLRHVVRTQDCLQLSIVDSVPIRRIGATWARPQTGCADDTAR
jgi:deazaflavin-dependent oxidoreductase (nitroreductase family)